MEEGGEGEEEEAHEDHLVAALAGPVMEAVTAGIGVATGPPRKIGSDGKIPKHFR